MNELFEQISSVLTLDRICIGIGSLFLTMIFNSIISYLRRPAPALSEMADHLLALLNNVALWEFATDFCKVETKNQIRLKQNGVGYTPSFCIILQWPMVFHGGVNLSNNLSTRELKLIKAKADKVAASLQVISNVKDTELHQQAKNNAIGVLRKARMEEANG